MTDEIKIQNIEFLTPARVTMNKGGIIETKMVSVDIINRKVYDEDGNVYLSDATFSYLDDITTLPEDFFASPSDVTEDAAEMMECTNESYLNKMAQGQTGAHDE